MKALPNHKPILCFQGQLSPPTSQVTCDLFTYLNEIMVLKPSICIKGQVVILGLLAYREKEFSYH